jgi:hypothetical protein
LGLKVRRYEVAHPDEAQWYADQCGFVIFWFRELLKRAQSADEKAAGEARAALQDLLVRGCMDLEPLALEKGESVSKAWAGKVLAYIGALVEADHEKLCEGNEAYKAERAKLGRWLRDDRWFPKKPLYQALHRELWLCRYYRGEVSWPKTGRYFGEGEEEMPPEYRPCLELPPFSAESWKKWDEFVWVLVRKHNPGLLEELRDNASRKEKVWIYLDGLSKQQLKSRKLFWKDFRPQFRNHLKAIADA